MARISSIAIAAAILLAPWIAYPQAYPSRPIRLIVPSAAGGPPDIAARPLATELTKQLGQQVVVDNRPGASGIIGFELIARAAADGYTLGFISNVIATNPTLYAKLPYDFAKDFQPVIHATSGVNLLAVTLSLPVRSVKELIDHARANPGKLSYGSSGLGASTHLSMELLKSITGTNIVLVLYKGMPQANIDVIGGQIHVVCEVISSILPHVRAGKVRGLAVTSLKRIPLAPELPTLDESGIPGYEITNWSGYAVPAGVPRNIVLQLNAEINKAQQTPSLSKAIIDRGAVAVGGTPEQFAEHVRKETERLGKLIKAAGIKPQ
jgi:tripartite-type tricarboxylate transporter receptor subunit TctC